MGLLSIGFNEFTLWGIACYIVAFGLFILGGYFMTMPVGRFMTKLANIVAIPLLIIGTILLFGMNFMLNVFSTTMGSVIAIGVIAVSLVFIMLFVLPKKQKDLL